MSEPTVYLQGNFLGFGNHLGIKSTGTLTPESTQSSKGGKMHAYYLPNEDNIVKLFHWTSITHKVKLESNLIFASHTPLLGLF